MHIVLAYILGSKLTSPSPCFLYFQHTNCHTSSQALRIQYWHTFWAVSSQALRIQYWHTLWAVSSQALRIQYWHTFWAVSSQALRIQYWHTFWAVSSQALRPAFCIFNILYNCMPPYNCMSFMQPLISQRELNPQATNQPARSQVRFRYRYIIFTVQNVISNSLEMAAGFPLSQLIFYVSGGLALCLLLAFIAILVGALAFKIKKKLSQRSYDTLH